MRFTQLFTRTLREVAKEETSRNAQLLIRAGYVNRLMAGAYSYLPLGLIVLNKIENIVREEMNAIGAQEVLMPALQPREIWETTKRWDSVDVLYKLDGQGEKDLALGPTHEEVVTPLVTGYVQSWRDLPQAVYQVQTKFRNEARPKAGLLRGREFRMKDMYSFHIDEADLSAFYEKTIPAYQNVYARCGIGDRTLLTFASGGMFSKYSHEFQTLTEYGEDTIYRMPGGKVALNQEVLDDPAALAEIIPNYKPGDEKQLESMRAIEVGNIFKLSTRFPDAFNAGYADKSGAKQKIWMGCYGIGPSRLMGTVVECLADDKGIVWPEALAPAKFHLVSLARDEADVAAVDAIYNTMREKGITVLYDDRADVQTGQKLNDADLLGMPHRLIVSPRTLKTNQLEYKSRTSDEVQMLTLDQVLAL